MITSPLLMEYDIHIGGSDGGVMLNISINRGARINIIDNWCVNIIILYLCLECGTNMCNLYNRVFYSQLYNEFTIQVIKPGCVSLNNYFIVKKIDRWFFNEIFMRNREHIYGHRLKKPMSYRKFKQKIINKLTTIQDILFSNVPIV